ncbi:MAG: DUF3313 domain-containing protein [Pseudomonadales bacterium]|jgi:hypothetical protein|nr:DUF3313 domain-containing protein [Gammaproteobacteria bacterium]MBP6052300.1 DUF3313 domain-containing protein [Pseudomonadales bacterium]MBK6581688.1 DUF3313 domain-containing protein [Gammaproteobacteria bacterium]MBK7170122.1 DUF3313 domain-containing protein [Gammaproteobacteria bacterium]MBK7520521.1 DUF3313 domain-containing protein [Gammaproteobacteria bacterium]
MHFGIPRICATTLLLCLLSGAASGGEPAETSYDGLERVKSPNAQMLYTRPGADLSSYKRVALLDCHVAFRKNWQRDQNSSGLRIGSADMERIKKNLAEEFRKIFVEELQDKGGYEIVTEGGDDVLILRPAIIDLDITAPDVMTAGRSRSFATSAGAMTLYIELFDGASGEILARAADREEARDMGRMTWQTSLTNRTEAEKMLRKWAALARAALDRARASGADQAQSND